MAGRELAGATLFLLNLRPCPGLGPGPRAHAGASGPPSLPLPCNCQPQPQLHLLVSVVSLGSGSGVGEGEVPPTPPFFDRVCFLANLPRFTQSLSPLSSSSSRSAPRSRPLTGSKVGFYPVLSCPARPVLTTSLHRPGIPLLDLLSIIALPSSPSPPCRFLVIPVDTKSTHRPTCDHVPHTPPCPDEISSVASLALDASGRSSTRMRPCVGGP